MCYKVSQAKNINDYGSYYKAPIIEPIKYLPEQQTYYNANGFAHPKLAVITSFENSRQLELMQWGLLPPTTWKYDYSKALIHSNHTLNAKRETIHEVKSFQHNINKYRCIIPVEGFFEYKHVGKDKLPYFIHPKERPYFNLAGVYSNYQNPLTNEWIKSFSIITGASNVLMSDIHNSKFRQPIIIDDEKISDWINPNTDQLSIDFIMQPCDDTKMNAYRVHRDLQKIGNQPQALEHIET